jgi:hypothetical protein
MTEPRSAIDILEEAVALLRSAPSDAMATYLIGAAPFMLAFLFFLTDMNRSPYAADRLAWESLAVALLYIWKNIFQARFMAKLYRAISPSENAASSPWQAILMQATLQPVGLLAPLPISWTVAFFRNVGLTRRWAAPTPFPPREGNPRMRRAKTGPCCFW